MFFRLPEEFIVNSTFSKDFREINPVSPQTSCIYIIETKAADVNGDGLLETITLKGKKSYSDSQFYEDLTISITNPKAGVNLIVKPKTNAGYVPHLFIGRFSKDKIPQVLLFIDSGGSGGYSFSYIYSFKNNIEKLLFDYEKFNELNMYNVTYEDYFKIKVQSKDEKLKGIIDLTSMRNWEYLSALYDANGKLLKSTEGGVLALGGVSPLSINGYDSFKILTNQRIIGLYNADTLGAIESILALNDDEFNTVITRLVVNM